MLKGRKILITGLTGRLGGAVAKALAHDNELCGLARYSGAGQKEYWEAAGVRTIVGDYGRGDLAAVPDDCEYVVHIAANCEPNSHEEGMIDNAEGVGRLMYHCRKAKAFLHTSTVGVYAHKDDPEALYSEDDPVGGGSLGHYTGTKLAGEGAARAFSAVFNIPTIICRMAVQYGNFQLAELPTDQSRLSPIHLQYARFEHGGMPAMYLADILAGRPVVLREGVSTGCALINNEDIVRFIEPLLNAAAVPAPTVNWCGDVNVSQIEMVKYLAELAGVEPKWEIVKHGGFPSFNVDPTKRRSITGPCQVHWKDGLKRMYEGLHATA